jgi:TonB family protein
VSLCLRGYNVNGVGKRKKIGELLHSTMLRAIIVSIVVHFSIVYLIPSVQILPPDSRYIEVEDVWTEAIEETGQETGNGDLQGEDETQERPQLDPIPTDIDAVEPDMVKESNPDTAGWGTAFIGIESKLPENLRNPVQVNQFTSHATQPTSTLRETLSPEDITKQVPESEVIQAESDMPPQDDGPLVAEQRYQDVIRSQTVQIPDEEISPGFTKLENPEILESKSQEVVALRKIPFDKRDKLDMPSVLLPDTQEISEQAKDDVVVAIDNMTYIASQNRSRQTRDETEVLPRAVISEESPSLNSRPFEQRGHITVSRTRTLQSPQETSLSPITFPRSSETKLTPVKETFAAVKEAIESEEVVVEAVEQLPSQDRLEQEALPLSFTDEPRSVSFPQNVQDGRHPLDQAQDRLKGGAHLVPQPRRGETKRSFVIGGKTQDNMTVSPRSHIGIVVKEETLPQTQEPDVTVQEDDVLERIAIDEVDTSSFAIEGPASRREVLYKPTWLPEVHIDVEVDIQLKFWVLPDGTVGEVIPLQRGDVRLERAAIEYLKNWRFTPVAPDTPQTWGIIPIKYKLQ